MNKAVYLGRIREDYYLARTLRELIGAARNSLSRERKALRVESAKQAALVRKRAYRSGIRNAQRAAGQKICSTINDLVTQLDQIKGTFENQALDIICAIAEQVIAEKISVSTTALKCRVHRALEKLRCANRISLHLHPQHAELALKDNSFSQSFPNLQVVANSSLEPGDLRFETAAGEIGLSWRAHLHRIFEAIKENGKSNSNHAAEHSTD